MYLRTMKMDSFLASFSFFCQREVIHEKPISLFVLTLRT